MGGERLVMSENPKKGAKIKSKCYGGTYDKATGSVPRTGAGGRIGFVDGMKMIAAEKNALGGFGNMKRFINACF